MAVSRTWDDLTAIAREAITSKTDAIYTQRLEFELDEIVKQGSEAKWIGWYSSIVDEGKKFPSNPKGLLLPWALGLWDIDPLVERKDVLCTTKASKILEFKNSHGHVPPDMLKDPDMPDIDIDCLPDARDPLKQQAIEMYGTDTGDGYGSVCSVGTWQAYKFKSAIVDTSVALNLMDRYAAERYTTVLPDDVDGLSEGGVAACKGMVVGKDGQKKECGTKHAELTCPKCGSADSDGPTLAKLVAEYQPLQDLKLKYPMVIDYAANLIGKVRSIGMHAGALIITDRPLYGNVPLAKSGKKGFWISLWTEGRNTQLSKLGYVKWDWLGLLTLQYIYECCKLIKENRGISFGDNMEGWDDIDPSQNRAGYYYDASGKRHDILLNDPDAIRTADEIKVDSIFQFDTPLAQSILGNGVRSFNDLLFYNAAGHPGPMQSIPEAVKNRDDHSGRWKQRLHEIHPTLARILDDTYGIILYQEQLAAIWQALAGFTSPEAQEARKAVAKKHTHKLKDIGKKWLEGATKHISRQDAEDWWNKMVTFGRYAFNKCIAKGTLVTDCITKQQVPIESAAGHFLHSEFGPDKIVAIHDCGIEPIYNVAFSNGCVETVTGGHKYLTPSGYKTVVELSSVKTHSIRYLRSDHAADRNRRGVDSRTLPISAHLRSNHLGDREEGNFSQLNYESGCETRGETEISVQTDEPGQTRLFGCFDSGSVLLDWASDGRWVCRREERMHIFRSPHGRPAYRCTVFGLLRRIEADVSPDDVQIECLQQAIGREIGRIWSDNSQERQGNASEFTAHAGFHEGVSGWGWYGRGEWQGLSDGWIRFELPAYIELEGHDCSECAVSEREQNCETFRYPQLVDCDVDWLETVQSDSVLDLSESKPSYGPEVGYDTIDIVSIELVGRSRVYSPEMASPWHNYAIADGHPIAANSHAISYCLVAYRCLWLKTHFAPEWWAAVMSHCHPDKLIRYMGVARSEGWRPTDITLHGTAHSESESVNFTTLDVTNLTVGFTASGNSVNQGLTGVKGFGKKVCQVFQGRGQYANIDEFVAGRKNKSVMERFIKLGAFAKFPKHSNMRALWIYYQLKYCSGITALKKEAREKWVNKTGWTDKRIAEERERQAKEYKLTYPKRTKIPGPINNWKPDMPLTLETINSLYSDDYTLEDRLGFQKAYLGYYIDSPMGIYKCRGGCTIDNAKRETREMGKGHVVRLEVIIEEFSIIKSKNNGKDYGKVIITDGIQHAMLLIWNSELSLQIAENLVPNTGVIVYATYEEQRNNFALHRKQTIAKLASKIENANF